MVKQIDEVKETKKQLKKLLRAGHYKVYCKLNHVSRSGMLRYIDFYTIVDDRPVYLTGYISKVTSYKRAPYDARYEGLKVEGCGMDMGFAVVHDLGRVLYPKGFKSSQRNAFNGMKPTDKGYEWDNDGGYRLKHSWL